MAVIVTRSLFTTIVTPDENILSRVPFLCGERLLVEAVYDQDEELDYLRTVDGRLLALPPDSWRPVDTP